MPAGSKFTVPVPLKQFFASFPLRIFGVENLEPSALFALRDIWAKPWQRCPPSPIRRLAEITLCQNAPHAPHIALETGGSLQQQAPKLLLGLAIAQFAIRSQQIKCEKARRVSRRSIRFLNCGLPRLSRE